jgi:hypothetical protein
LAVRSLPSVSMVHSNVFPGRKFKNSAIPSGIVALRLFDFGRAIDVLDVSGIVYSTVPGLFISTYILAEELI